MKKTLILIALFFTACGYVPLNEAASNVLGDNVSVITIINKAEPKNSIVLNDNFTNYLEHYMHKNIDKNANSKIVLKMLSSDFVALYYDELGYARSYKAIITLEFNVTFEDGSYRKIISKGEHVFNTDAISVISDEQKRIAIDLASRKAFNDFTLKLVL